VGHAKAHQKSCHRPRGQPESLQPAESVPQPSPVKRVPRFPLTIEQSEYTYITIMLGEGDVDNSDERNRIEVCVFFDPNGEIVFRLEGLEDSDWSEFDFPLHGPSGPGIMS
jgi:hypothetical protein